MTGKCIDPFKVTRFITTLLNKHFPKLPKWINKELFYTKMTRKILELFTNECSHLSGMYEGSASFIDITSIVGFPLASAFLGFRSQEEYDCFDPEEYTLYLDDLDIYID